MSKSVLWLSIGLFGALGSWVPTWWHAGLFSGWSLLGSTIGSLLGIYAGIRFNDYLGGN